MCVRDFQLHCLKWLNIPLVDKEALAKETPRSSRLGIIILVETSHYSVFLFNFSNSKVISGLVQTAREKKQVPFSQDSLKPSSPASEDTEDEAAGLWEGSAGAPGQAVGRAAC